MDKYLAASRRYRQKPSVAVLSDLQRLRHGNIRSLAFAIFNRVWPAHASLAPAILTAIANRNGIEIGGPSHVFAAKGILPVYPRAARIDNVNFARETAWETELRDGGPFLFNPSRSPGRQFLREAMHLRGIDDHSYDFVLSSHCLEHSANPLAALREWHRIVRPGGCLVLLLPDPTRTFDRRRPITTLAHLEADFVRNTTEDDLTHLDEILALHDLSRDAAAGTPAEFRARSLRNVENRCLHHHVFDLALQRQVLEATGWNVVATERVRPLHLIAFARRREQTTP